MKVAFAIEYFPPFAPGGGEWSTYYLAKNLSKKKINITIITPNLGAAEQEKKEGFLIKRFPFYLNLKTFKKLPGNFAYTNPLWLFWSAFFYYKYLKDENPDIIHVHGKYSIPPIILANIFLKKPTVATIRDYMPVCNYGLCLTKGDNVCNLMEYFMYDFKQYWRNYVLNKNLFNLILNFIYLIYGRVSKNYIKFFTNQIDTIISLSTKQKNILEKNGINKSIQVIHNSFEFKKLEVLSSKKIKKNILFVGRLTPGKGVELLLKAIPFVKKNIKGFRFTFVGSGFLTQKIKKLKLAVILTGQIPHSEVENYYKSATLVVVPSIWPEPLARVAIESLSYGTPVVVTDSGGFPEVIKDGVFGYISSKNTKSLSENIIKGIKQNKILRQNIKVGQKEFKSKFSEDVTKKHINLYRKLINDKKNLRQNS